MIGWDSLTAVQQSNMLAYDQVADYTRGEREIALAGGKQKPSSSGEAKPSEAQRQGAAKKGKRVS